MDNVHHNSWLIGCWVWTLEDGYLQPENKCLKVFRKEQNGKKKLEGLLSLRNSKEVAVSWIDEHPLIVS
jgi:hypothetical protein